MHLKSQVFSLHQTKVNSMFTLSFESGTVVWDNTCQCGAVMLPGFVLMLLYLGLTSNAQCDSLNLWRAYSLEFGKLYNSSFMLWLSQGCDLMLAQNRPLTCSEIWVCIAEAVCLSFVCKLKFSETKELNTAQTSNNPDVPTSKVIQTYPITNLRSRDNRAFYQMH